MNFSSENFLLAVIFAFLAVCSTSKDGPEKSVKDGKDGAEWKKKDIRDYSDADMERLFEQWEEGDEDELEADELPEWKREPPKIDMSQMDPKDPEGFLKASKKGRTLMMFATVSGNPTERETTKLSDVWHNSLYSAHIDTQKFIVSSNRILFMLQDGSKAWQVKDFLVEQERCAEVSVEGQNFPGKGADKQKEKKEEL